MFMYQAVILKLLFSTRFVAYIASNFLLFCEDKNFKRKRHYSTSNMAGGGAGGGPYSTMASLVTITAGSFRVCFKVMFKYKWER